MTTQHFPLIAELPRAHVLIVCVARLKDCAKNRGDGIAALHRPYLHQAVNSPKPFHKRSPRRPVVPNRPCEHQMCSAGNGSTLRLRSA